ncbi:MAG: murein L,D-transpeptidase family protein [Pseudomonadota bacterium]
MSSCGTANADRLDAAKARVEPALRRAVADAGLDWGAAVFMRIFKSENVLEVWLEDTDGDFALFKAYPVCAWSGALGPKLKTGDGQAPEGFYFVTPGAMNPNSDYHLSFNLGFPNAFDRAHGRTGSFLMVHGDCVSIGCYAMTDGGIEEIYLLADAAFAAGQPFFRVHAFPFRMTDEAMATYDASPWIDFWRNLKTGYDWFEEKGAPPNAAVDEKAYVFSDVD